MKTLKTLNHQRYRRSLHGVVVCVHSRDGWCVLRDQRKTAYSDNVETKCGMVVTLPWGIERRQPDCIECKKADNNGTERTAPQDVTRDSGLSAPKPSAPVTG